MDFIKMNDFTKEELEFIFKYMMQCGSRGNLSQYNDVLIKVKSMIDSYCEHEHIPNEETAKAIEEARKDLLEKKHYTTGINLVCGKCKQNVNSFRIRYDNKQQAYIVTAYCHGEKEVVHEDSFLDLNFNGTFFDWVSS